MPSKTEIKLELETRRKSVAEAIIAAQRRGDQAAVDSLMPAHREVQLALDKLALASAEAMLPLLAALNERIAAALAKAKMGAIEGAFARQPRPVPAGGGDGASEAEVEPTVAPGPAPVTEPAVAPEPVTEAESEEELPPETEPATGGAPAPALAHVSAPDPATAPAVPGAFTLTEAHLIALWRRSSFPIDGRGIIVFGIRGMLPVEFAGTPLGAAHPVTFGAPNYRTMCCTLGHWRPGLGLTLFPGSTVPFGSSVEQARARNGVGTNQMGPGRYRNYVAGWHKRSEGPSGHWALVQDCAITLQRSGDDADYDADDRWEVGRIAGDNIHCAHNMGPDSNIAGASFSSLGCQVVAGKVDKGRPGSERGPWAKFIAPFLGPHGQRRAEYVLFDGAEVRMMIATRYAGKTVILRFGSAGDLVRALQTRLGAALGRHVKVDGDFGPATFEAVLEFQLREFGPQADDGVVGPETAAALGLSLPLFDFEGAIAGDSGLATPAPVALGGSAAPAAANGPALAWGAVTGSKHGPAFKQKVLEIAARLGCDPSHLMAVMAFETGASFAPDKRNPVSGATGLIQFMRPTAEGLGTTQENLAAMTALGQLDFVERHIRQNARGLPHLSLSDLYMTVLLPSAVGKDEAHVLFQKPSTAYTQNAGLDRDGDGRITKLEATAKVQEALERGMQAANRG